MRIQIIQHIIEIMNKWVKDKNEREFCTNHLSAEIHKIQATRSWQYIGKSKQKALNTQ